jgi:C-terminal processing protease CtpA/Prc
VAAHADELARTPALVIDVRGNGGGSDFVYAPVLPYVYTRPIWRIGVDLRVSADNARLRREVAELIAPNAPEAARVLREESERLAVATVPYLRREPPVEIVRLPAVLPNPARVAVLIDRAGSAAENFLLDVRQSWKVTLLGQESSAGVADYGEMMGMEAPSRRFRLAWATTRSLRLPNDPVDPDGITPDVRIPAEVADPVAYAADWLRAQAPHR